MFKKIMCTMMIITIMTQPVYASSLNDLKPGDNQTSVNEGYVKSQNVNIDEMAEKVSQSRETVNDFYWDIDSRDNTIRIDLNKGVTRFEVFYSSSGDIPFIAFQTPDGDLYESGKDTEYIITRANNQIPGHSDLRYEVIYIISPSSSDNIQCKISLDSKTHDFMMIKSRVPQGWEKFSQEYRTEPEKLVIWGFHNSENTITDLVAIAENVDIKPTDNTIGEAEAPAPEEKDNTGFIISIFIAAIIGISVMLLLNNMSKKHQAEDATKARINKKNDASKKKKEMNKKKLDNALDKYQDEYKDDEMEDYFSEPAEIDGDDITLPLEEKVAFVEVEEEPDTKKTNTPVKEKPQKEIVKEEKEEIVRPIVKDEKITSTMPSWMN